MAVALVGMELQEIRGDIDKAPFMHIGDERLEGLSLHEAAQLVRRVLGIVRGVEQRVVDEVVATIPPTRTVARESGDYLEVIAPLTDGRNEHIATADAALSSIDTTTGMAGEQTLAMLGAIGQATGQLAMVLGNLQTYEQARTVLVANVEDARNGRNELTAALCTYEQEVLGLSEASSG